MSKSKQKGTRAETALVNFLQGQGLDARRVALSGMLDKGDVEVLDFLDAENLVFEVKTGKQSETVKRSLFDEWCHQTINETKNWKAFNKKAALGILCITGYGKSHFNWDFYIFLRTTDKNGEPLRVHCHTDELLDTLESIITYL